jgi:hypothetical protein
MDECNQTNSLLDISCIHTHVLRFEHLIEHVGSLLGEEKKKGRAFGLTNLYFKKCTISKLSNNKQTCTIMDVL